MSRVRGHWAAIETTRHQRTRRRVGVLLVSAALTAGMVAGMTPAAASPALRSAPVIPHDKSIPVTPVASHYRAPTPMPPWHAAAVTWPAGSATVSLPAGTSGASSDSAQQSASQVRAGSLPVWLGPAATRATGIPRSAVAAAPAASTEQVSVLPRAASTAVGVSGVLLSVQRTDGSTGAATTHLTIGYTGFRDAFGGDWASRLRLVRLPGCALTTPGKPACRTQTPLASSTDVAAGTVSADVALAAPTTTAPTMVFAAASSPTGSGGDFTATSLKPSGSWQAGGSADAFSWAYPIAVPPVPGGLVPTVGLSYDSQSVDGLTSSTNNQPSWIGDGWNYSPGFVERSYSPCSQNPTGPSQTGDNCWSANNTLTLSLGGQTSVLIRDDATGTYHPQDDSNERVQYVGSPNAPNGVQGNEHFVVTTTDGTQYYFGLNQLPGWASGNPTTNSVWTEPVYATASGQPCYNANFAASSCQQAYRWNLDYVVDTHADAVSYFYATETNAYAADTPTTAPATTATASYIRGGYLTKIQYGQRAGQVYSTQPAAQVLFGSAGRCTQSSCDPSTLSLSTAASWPDVPEDLACAVNTTCAVSSPGFWSDYVLSSIQTQALYGSTETTVDSWSLAHSFPDTGDGTTPVVWLSSITHTGQDPDAIGSPSATPPAATSPPITMPPVVFTGTPLSNRVLLGIGYAPITRQRLTGITTETGEIISVGYSSPGCGASRPSDPSQNTMLCFPGYWTPTGQSAPILDWFNKFIVTGVTEQDPTGGAANDTVATTYTPVGAPAWHYNDNPLTPTGQRTWDQWRGYAGMIVSTGTPPDPVTKTQYSYFRGMNGDTLPGNGTRSVAVTDSRGDPAVTDANQYSGAAYETTVYNGSAVVTDTITDPWSSAATASHTLSGLPTQQSFLTGTADTRIFTPLANGSTRETETDYTHDTSGRVTRTNDLGDVTAASGHLCTTTSYADNTTAWILDLVAEAATVSVDCATNPNLPADAVSDTRSFYDGSTTLGGAPTVGDVTMTQQASSYIGSTPNLITTATSTVDQYGRTLTATNGDGKTTTTAYTPATGAEPTSVAVTDPMRFLTTTTYDPLRDLPQSKTDPAKYVSSQQYDALGRLTVANPVGIPAATKYTYTVSNTGPSVVDTYSANTDGTTYRLSETLYDARLRARETQTQTPDNGRDITDTIYNTDGSVSETTDPYFTSSAVSATYVQAQAGQVPSATGYAYDSAGRKTTATAYALGSPTWQTTYAYGGNFTTTVPPQGATATTTFTDARGNTTDLYQYHAGVPTDPVNDPPGDYSATHYAYTPAGKQASVADAAGNSWSYQYDLLGEQTTAKDPDTGTTTTAYDNAGLVTSATDARGKQTTTTYDNDARKTAQYDTTGNVAPAAGNKIAAWTYDTVLVGISGSRKAVGYPASTTSYTGGDTYTQTVLNYNLLAKPGTQRTTLTGTDAGLLPSGGLVTGYGYTVNGIYSGPNDAAVDGLPSEAADIGFDPFGQPTSLGSAIGSYVEAVGYSEYGQPRMYTLPASNGNVWIATQYDDQTHAPTDIQTTDTNSSTVVDDTSYTYAGNGVSQGAGLVTSTTDNQNAGATVDTQCFGYDYATRLNAAWTATDHCAGTPTPGSSASVGGPAPYWQSWTYDPAGDRATQTDHDTAGNTTNDTTTTNTYPTPGSATDQPHTLTSSTATGPQAAQDTASYTYDPAGNTTGITGGVTGNQTLTWDDQNHLASDTTTTGTSNYVYDSSGNLIIRRDPGQTTMFFGDEQLVLNTTTNTATATRYYNLGSVTIATRSSIVGGGTTNPVYLVPDRQGTDQLSVDSATYAVTRRQYLPFGQTRGTPPTTWPGGDTGYIGGTPDPTTSLENLGAREYSPASGRFLSADPILELTDPTQMGGYDYAGNDPVTGSDPSGLRVDDSVPGLNTYVGAPANDQRTPQIQHYAQLSTRTWYAHAGQRAWWQAYNHKHMPVVSRPQAPPPARNTAGGKAAGEFPANDPLLTNSSPTDWGGFFSTLGLIALNVGAFLTTPIPVLGEADDAGVLALDASVVASDATRADEALSAASRDTSSSPAEDATSACANSFAGTTPVLMADGSSKPIDQIKVGDIVDNAVPGAVSGTRDQTHTVTAVHVTYTDHDYTDVTVDTEHGPATITGTAHHLYWDATTHAWTLADQLHAGNQLQTSGGAPVTILAVRDYTTAMVTYNLTINTLHTYYVLAGQTPVLVHNCGGLPDLSASRSQLEAKFKHAGDFGVTESRGAAGFKSYGQAVQDFVQDPATTRFMGTYRGNSAILNYNLVSRLVVIQSPAGDFISGWQMTADQLQNVMQNGSLGGG